MSTEPATSEPTVAEPVAKLKLREFWVVRGRWPGEA